MAHRIAQRNLSFLDEHHYRRARDRLRLRRDAEDRVGRHPPSRFLVGPADRALVDWLAVTQHQHHRARDLVLVDIALKELVDAGEAIRVETGNDSRRRYGLPDLRVRR